jgi:lysozyme
MNLIEMIKMNEGNVMENGRHIPYEDIVGKLTIGYGRNLTDNGITPSEAQTLLWNDIENVMDELDKNLSFFHDLTEPRRYALIDMCFNLGLTRFLRFERMLEALEKKDYTKASLEAIDSKWANQVGSRALRDAKMIEEG